MADVFISYSRRDKEFVQVLYDALRASQYDTWVDWQDIAPTTEWWKEIEAGIEAAHTFIFVISQDSITSKYCREEIDHALEHGKRLIPVLRRKDFAREDSHPKLGQHQWISFQAEDDFDSAFATLVEAIDTDLEHKKNHTRLQVRAVEWAQSKRDGSLLLRGSELNKAEQWLLQASAGKDPKPTELQAGYIAASREEATQAQERANHRQRLTVGGLSGLLVLAIGAGIWAWVQQRKAINAQFFAESLTMEAYLEAGLEQQAMTQAMRTGQALQNPKAIGLAADTRFRAMSSIREVVFGVKKSETFIGHKDSVRSVAFSPDGKMLATTSDDGTLKLWSVDGQEQRSLEGYESNWYLDNAAFSPDGKFLTAPGKDNSAKVWRVDNGQQIKTFKGHTSSVKSVAFSPNGKTIATASEDGTAKLWDIDGKELHTLRGHKSSVNSVMFSPDGNTIATASADNAVKLWTINGQELHTLSGHSQSVNSVAFSPDGNTIATASADSTVKLWSKDGQELKTLNVQSPYVNSVAFSPDGKMIATAGSDGIVKLWDQEGKELETFRGHSASINDVAFSPDGNNLASASADRTIKLWSWNKNSENVQTLKGHSSWVTGVAFSPDGETIATASFDQTVKLWNRQGEELQTFKGHSDGVWSVAFSPDGETIATASFDQTVKLWNRQGEELQTFKGHSDEVWSVAFSPDGETIATASADQTVKLWNRQGEELQTFKGHSNGVSSVAFSPDGETIATASYDQTVKLWNRQGEELQTFKGHSAPVSSVAFSPDSETIATASDDQTVKLWNRQGEELQTFKGHSAPVWSVVFSPDGETIATASADQTVKLWNRQGEELQTLKGHSAQVWSVAFSPDSETIATASADQTVKLWNFQLDDLMTKGCNWLGTYFVKQSPELLMELETCQNSDPSLKIAAAPMLVTRGETLARDGNIKRAKELFKQATVWDSRLDIDPKTKAQNVAQAQTLVDEAEELAQAEKISEATAKLAEAKQLDSSLDFEPETRAKELALQGYLTKGNQFLNAGKVPEAIVAYRQAEALALKDSISDYDWNALCWDGSTYNQAEAVMFACEKAVSLAPEDGNIIDSRGLARALTGDTQGAIADFKVFIEWTQNEEVKAQRQEWIKALEQGKNPFTPEVLESLRQQ